jgi:type III secretion protein SpaR/YscT/HrcT
MPSSLSPWPPWPLWPPELERWLWAWGLGAARALPIAWQIPAFGGEHVPAQVRVGLGLALSAVCLPQVMASLPGGAGGLLWLLLLAREVAVGLTVGFVAASLFRAAEAAGRLVDTLRGANLAEVLSPAAEGRSSPLGDVYLLLAVVIFLELGGVGHVATALARSYEGAPLTWTAAPTGLGEVAKLVILSSAKLIEGAVGLAAPALVALLLADLVLGAIARLAPQIPVYFVGMPLKALAGVGVVLLGLGSVEAALVGGVRGWAVLVGRAFAVWR